MSLIQSISGAAAQLLGTARISVDEHIERQTAKVVKEPALAQVLPPRTNIKPRLLTSQEMVKVFGQPGDPDNLVTITTPYPMRIAWEPTRTISKVTVHKKVADPLTNFFNDLLRYYGSLRRLQELEIDMFGGLYNYRPQRGLEKRYEKAVKERNTLEVLRTLSRHAWASALDLDPVGNELKVRAPKAQFSKPEYKPLVDIAYANGFIGYGIERGNDWMHWEYGMIS